MTNQILDTISTRYTARSYTGKPVEKGDLEAVAVAGASAPTAMNKQPFNISVVTDKKLINELESEGVSLILADPERQNFAESIKKRGGKLFYNAPAIIFVSIDGSGETQDSPSLRDAGIVIENMALAAHSLGLGNCICGLAGIPLAGPKGADFVKRIGIPEGYKFGISLLLGETDTKPTPHGYNPAKINWVV